MKTASVFGCIAMARPLLEKFSANTNHVMLSIDQVSIAAYVLLDTALKKHCGMQYASPTSS
jgi:hypothetical protein